jgi:hypothetical protein
MEYQKTGFRTRTILCMPVFNGSKEVIAVAQLINKKSTDLFTKLDEQMFEVRPAARHSSSSSPWSHSRGSRNVPRRIGLNSLRSSRPTAVLPCTTPSFWTS